MKKLFKKTVAAILTVAMAMSVGMPAFAADNTYNMMAEVADDIIKIENSTNEIGDVITQYNNLQAFKEKVQEQNPEVIDYEIAKYLMQLTGQETEGLPEKEVLKILKYDNITATHQYVYTDENGTVQTTNMMPLASGDPMKISAFYSATDLGSTETCYDVWGLAQWETFPSVRYSDAFAVGHNVTIDSSVIAEGYVLQSFYCASCNKTTYKNRFVETNDEVDSGLTMKHGVAPSLHFSGFLPQCDYCGDPVDDKNFSVRLSYGVIAPNNLGNIQASYGHSQLNLGGINVSFSGSTPIFTPVLGSSVTTYRGSVISLE